MKKQVGRQCAMSERPESLPYTPSPSFLHHWACASDALFLISFLNVFIINILRHMFTHRHIQHKHIVDRAHSSASVAERSTASKCNAHNTQHSAAHFALTHAIRLAFSFGTRSLEVVRHTTGQPAGTGRVRCPSPRTSLFSGPWSPAERLARRLCKCVDSCFHGAARFCPLRLLPGPSHALRMLVMGRALRLWGLLMDGAPASDAEKVWKSVMSSQMDSVSALVPRAGLGVQMDGLGAPLAKIVPTVGFGLLKDGVKKQSSTCWL